MRGSWEGQVCILKDSRSSLVLGDSVVGTSLWVLVCSASHRALVPQGMGLRTEKDGWLFSGFHRQTVK